MSDITEIITFFQTCVLNVWNCLRNHAGIYFYVMVAMMLYPVLSRIVRAIRGGK